MTEYHVHLGESGYGYVQFYKWALALRKVNTRRVHCIECKSDFEAGECVYHRMYQGNGFVCIPCAKKMIVKFGDMGYSQNILYNLQANNFTTGRWSAQEVAEALQMKVEVMVPEIEGSS